VCARDFCIVVLRGLVVGDINIHLDRPDDSASRQFTDTLAAHGLACHATVTTVNGGLLDVVATCDDLPLLPVEVVDVGLSDHRLLRWTTSLAKPSPAYTTRTTRPWRQLNADEFRAALMWPPLCHPDAWTDRGGRHQRSRRPPCYKTRQIWISVMSLLTGLNYSLRVTSILSPLICIPLRVYK